MLPTRSHGPNGPWVYDNCIPLSIWSEIGKGVDNAKWEWGWKSNPKNDKFSFLHIHFGGANHPDHVEEQFDCESQIREKYKVLHDMWGLISTFRDEPQKLVRCYANGYPYGCEGTTHTDSSKANSLTWIFYPNSYWHPDWGGETMFFDDGDVVAAIYPKPGRLIAFKGTMHHVARGVTKLCPVMRVTVMFKSEIKDGGQSIP